MPVVEHKLKIGAGKSGRKRAGQDMDLDDVLEGIECNRVSGPSDPRILAVVCDSRKVAPSVVLSSKSGAMWPRHSV